jgi:hypothetical protein
MTGQHEQIADALREMADQAAAPRMSIDAAWRAGRRRRRSTMTASVASAAGVIAAAALVPFAVASGSGHSAPGAAGRGSVRWTHTPVSTPIHLGPLMSFPAGKPVHVRPVAKVQFSQVSLVAGQPCPRGSHGVPGISHHTCYYLTGKPVTADVLYATVVRVPGTKIVGPPAYTIDIGIVPSAATALDALMSRIKHQPPPRDEIAWITHGVVVVTPATVGLVPSSFQLGTNGDRAAQQQLVNEIEGHFPGHSH